MVPKSGDCSTVKDTHIDKLIRQFNSAVEQINSLKDDYRPENSDNVGKIAANIVCIYEMFKSGNVDKMGYENPGPIPRLKAYLVEQGVFDKDFCLVLVKASDPGRQYGYTRLKVLKFLRGEAVHGSTIAEERSSLIALKSYLYEENRDFKPVFAIRRDFLQFPNVITPNEEDSHSPFDEPLDVGNGRPHSLTTIESVVFSICNEMGHMSRTGTMGWNKAGIAFDVCRFRSLLNDPIARNIIDQSAKWNDWNGFPIVGAG